VEPLTPADSRHVRRDAQGSQHGTHARPVDPATLERIGKRVAVLATAERHAEVARDLLAPGLLTSSGPGLPAAQRALGEALYELLDGPDRALAWRLDRGRGGGATGAGGSDRT